MWLKKHAPFIPFVTISTAHMTCGIVIKLSEISARWLSFIDAFGCEGQYTPGSWLWGCKVRTIFIWDCIEPRSPRKWARSITRTQRKAITIGFGCKATRKASQKQPQPNNNNQTASHLLYEAAGRNPPAANWWSGERCVAPHELWRKKYPPAKQSLQPPISVQHAY